MRNIEPRAFGFSIGLEFIGAVGADSDARFAALRRDKAKPSLRLLRVHSAHARRVEFGWCVGHGNGSGVGLDQGFDTPFIAKRLFAASFGP